MKKIFLVLFVSSLIFANNFKVGTSVGAFQDNEGSGISFGYMLNPKLLLETSYNEYYLRAVKNGSTKESWSSYNTSTLGIRYYIKSFAKNEIKTFVSAGIEHIYKETKLSKNTPKLNTYFLAGVDFDLGNDFFINFSMGSGGKGDVATEYQNEPSYAHGFITKLALEYSF